MNLIDNLFNYIESFENLYVYYLNSSKLNYFLMFFFIFFIYFYETTIDRKPNLICKNEKYKNFLIKYCHVNRPIYFCIWAFNAISQTYLASYIRNKYPKLAFKRELIKLPDGEIASLDWYNETDLNFKEENPNIVFILPGVTGDSRARYLKALIPHIHTSNNKSSSIHRVCVINNRGRGELKLRLAKLYSLASCDDLNSILNHIKSKYPKSKIIGIGISFGAALIGRYLIESSDRSLIDSAILISSFFNLSECYKSLESNIFNLKINYFLTSLIKKIVIENRDVLESNKNLDIDTILKSKTFREIDTNLTIKMYNYNNLEDYLEDVSLVGKIHLIKRPTLFLNSIDDMFQPFSSIPINEFEESNYAALLLTKRGGHHGFITSNLPFTTSNLPFINRILFMEKLCKKYVSAFFELGKSDIEIDLN